MATTPPTRGHTLGAAAFTQAEATHALATLVAAVRALPTADQPHRAHRRWWEILLFLPSPAERAARRWHEASGRVDAAADALHRSHARLQAHLRTQARDTNTQNTTPAADATAALMAAHQEAGARVVDAQTQALAAQIAHVLDHALPLWETHKGLRRTPNAAAGLPPTQHHALLEALA